MNKRIGQQVYLDRNQCKQFEVEYFGASTFQVSAAALLESKDYDSDHRNLLSPLGSQLVTLEKSEEDNPGWYWLANEGTPA